MSNGPTSYAPSVRPVYMIIPDEDWQPGDEHRYGKINLSLYGTRDAAQNWTHEYTRTLTNAGFRVGTASACNFFHPEWEVAVTVPGDDFTAAGPEDGLRKFRKALEERYEIKVDVLGPGPDHKREI